VDFLPDGYRFSERQPDGGWKRLETPPELAPRAFAGGLRVAALRVRERGAPQALRAGSDGAFAAGAPAGESLATQREGGGGRRIVFGSRAPAFELELAEDGRRYRIAGRIDGRVERLAGVELAR